MIICIESRQIEMGKNDFVLSGVTLQNYSFFYVENCTFYIVHEDAFTCSRDIVLFCEKTYQNI